jgi:O-acetyl-ADP-ribose deacetylase (regulator of RNase III)
LAGGGGVDGAIHRAAGPQLAAACKLIGGCGVGEAVTTEGYHLKARKIIHTVGPVWRGGIFNEAELLASCYKQSLNEAAKHGCRTVAFPNISTGIYGFPKDKAAKIAITAIEDYLNQHPDTFDQIYLVCFDADNYHIYQQLLKASG